MIEDNSIDDAFNLNDSPNTTTLQQSAVISGATEVEELEFSQGQDNNFDSLLQ